MTVLTVELNPTLWQLLQTQAQQRQQSVEMVAAALLEAQLRPSQLPKATEQADVLRLLAESGLLTELGDGLREKISTTAVNHENVVAALGRAGGEPLSQIILNQRERFQLS